jgi:hypothetical protein
MVNKFSELECNQGEKTAVVGRGHAYKQTNKQYLRARN